MKKNVIFIPLVALLLVGCNSKGGRRRSTPSPTSRTGTTSPTTSPTTGGGGGGGDIKTFEPDDFYYQHYANKKDCFGNDVSDYHLYDSFGDDLFDAIHNYCIDQHTTYLLYKVSANYAQYFRETDKNPSNGKTIQFYTGRELSGGSGSREHVWACANSADLWYRSSKSYEHQIDQHDYWGGGSDIYNLHACDGGVNGARGNARFAVFTDEERASAQSPVGDGGPYTLLMNSAGNKAEPVKEFRGNIARIVMYMWCHYKAGERNAYYPSNYFSQKPVYTIEEAVNQDGHTPMMCGSLKLDDIIGYNNDEQIYAALKQWNREDPPDANEKYANNYIEANLQGNRNPFIDYPDLVDSLLDWVS